MGREWRRGNRYVNSWRWTGPGHDWTLSQTCGPILRNRWLVFHRFPKMALCSSLLWPLQKGARDGAWANEISSNQTDFFINIFFAEVPEKCWLWQLTKINFHTGEKWEPRATARTNTGNLNMRNNVSLWGGSRLGEGDGMEGGGGGVRQYSTFQPTVS